MNTKSATYWVTAKKQLAFMKDTCRPENIEVYQKAIRYAEKKLRVLRRNAGII